MKHKTSITLILLGMFLITQFVGIFVINAYAPSYNNIVNPKTGVSEMVRGDINLPFGLQASQDDAASGFISILFSFILAIVLIFILMKYKWKIVIRFWFFFVIVLALGVTINAFLRYTSLTNVSIISLARSEEHTSELPSH